MTGYDEMKRYYRRKNNFDWVIVIAIGIAIGFVIGLSI
jgi:hypothetical protein